MSSTESTATPAIPTSPSARGLSESYLDRKRGREGEGRQGREKRNRRETGGREKGERKRREGGEWSIEDREGEGGERA